jgi:hypothetical protein
MTESRRPLGQTTLVCRLRRKSGRSPTAGVVELENTSPSVVELEVRNSPLQYLNLVVTGPSGAVVSHWYYGDLFSPLAEPYTFQLAPGEKLIANVSLLGNVPEEKRLPGAYTVQAVYEHRGLRAVSEQVRVEVGMTKPGHEPKARKGRRLD